MNKEAEKILGFIEVDEKEALLFELRQRILVATVDEAEQIIDELSHREKSHYVGHSLFDDQPYYYLFEAYAHFILPNHQDEAIDRASRAASLFRMRNSQWNEALVHWFLSILYEEHSRKEELCKELQMATAILEGIAKGFQQEGRVEDCQSCQAILRQLYRCIVLSEPAESLIILSDKSYLFPPWMPVYGKIRTGEKNILIWDEPL